MGNMFADSGDAGPTPYTGEVCDPHVHFWDFDARPNPHHADGLAKKLPKWLPADYWKDAAALGPALTVTSSVRRDECEHTVGGGR